MRVFRYLPMLILFFAACQSPKEKYVSVVPGILISESGKIEPGIYEYSNVDKSISRGLITIRGNDLELDFSNVEFIGNKKWQMPDAYSGLCIKVEDGKNITIRNLKIRGFKIALMAENVDSLRLINCDFSYNYRQKLGSTWAKEDTSDWLSYHQNDADEWMRYGMAVYLKNCDYAFVKELYVTGGQNGLMLSGCDDGLFYNNTIHFNSGVGIGLYRSSRNRVLHNKLDWNVRGYSHGVYARGQDSAALLCYEQSNGNVFAFNSATHSGDGFFLWAGHTTMNTGRGGCNDNLIYDNDFSFAPTNGVEVTFSRNKIINNRLIGCKYGIWGGFSYESVFAGNIIQDNNFGLAVEHGQDNSIQANYFNNNEVGVQLFERNLLPEGWNYIEMHGDVNSRDYKIEDNTFIHNEITLDISASDRVSLFENTFANFEKLLTGEEPNPEFSFSSNEVFQINNWGDATFYRSGNKINNDLSEIDSLSIEQTLEQFDQIRDMPEPMPDSIPVSLSATQLQGRPYILVNEWGPYDFLRPSIWLREVSPEGDYVFVLLGPTGNWKSVDGEGFLSINPKTGTFPATLQAKADPNALNLKLDFEFIGEKAITQFGDTLRRGTVIPFQFRSIPSELTYPE